MTTPVPFDDRSRVLTSHAASRFSFVHKTVGLDGDRVPGRNKIIARHLRGKAGAQPANPVLMVRLAKTALPAAIGLTLVFLPALPSTIDGLLTVGLVGMAAGRLAAMTDRRPRSPVRRRPANDNPFRPVLPPHLLRC